MYILQLNDKGYFYDYKFGNEKEYLTLLGSILSSKFNCRFRLVEVVICG